MTIQQQIHKFILDLPEKRQKDIRLLHETIVQLLPKEKLWFDDGRNEDGKTITNPTIGYGLHTITYANGKTKDWFRIGLSANATGTSIYVLGLADQTYLSRTFGQKLGKASVTSYCIRFKKLEDINIEILKEAIRLGCDQ